ncbi:hypothetical protein WOLCODRAFT_147239 [Wolfiporia cocos MD-104 SS10]|uniref:Uncharacterized protein n=1 Tax=Wolfiporia cocos (strain MD-104) TaxID=742152 RepID=A0A2H3J325_WOLCO|nr:hypothetical protein WOLCODRAFT_147239 [Wolfiporia cocos MD-104 SS10]
MQAQDTSGDVVVLGISTMLQTEGHPSYRHAGERTAQRMTTATERADEAQTDKVPRRQRNIFVYKWKTTHPDGRKDEFDKAFSALSKEQLQVYTAATNELDATSGALPYRRRAPGSDDSSITVHDGHGIAPTPCVTTSATAASEHPAHALGPM